MKTTLKATLRAQSRRFINREAEGLTEEEQRLAELDFPGITEDIARENKLLLVSMLAAFGLAVGTLIIVTVAIVAIF